MKIELTSLSINTNGGSKTMMTLILHYKFAYDMNNIIVSRLIY